MRWCQNHILRRCICVRAQWAKIARVGGRHVSAPPAQESSARTPPFWTLQFQKRHVWNVQSKYVKLLWLNLPFWQQKVNALKTRRDSKMMARGAFTWRDTSGFQCSSELSALVCKQQRWCSKKLKVGFLRMQTICRGQVDSSPRGLFFRRSALEGHSVLTWNLHNEVKLPISSLSVLKAEWRIVTKELPWIFGSCKLWQACPCPDLWQFSAADLKIWTKYEETRPHLPASTCEIGPR